MFYVIKHETNNFRYRIEDLGRYIRTTGWNGGERGRRRSFISIVTVVWRIASMTRHYCPQMILAFSFERVVRLMTVQRAFYVHAPPPRYLACKRGGQTAIWVRRPFARRDQRNEKQFSFQKRVIFGYYFILTVRPARKIIFFRLFIKYYVTKVPLLSTHCYRFAGPHTRVTSIVVVRFSNFKSISMAIFDGGTASRSP